MVAAVRCRIQPLACLREGARLVGPSYLRFVALGAVASALVVALPPVLVFVALVSGLLRSTDPLAAAIASALAILPSALVVGPMACGLHLCCRAALRREQPTFGMLFGGFRHVVPSLVVVLFALLSAVAVYAGAAALEAAVAPDEPPPAVRVAVAIAAFLLSTCAQSIAWIACPLIVDRGLSGPRALAASARAMRLELPGMLALGLIHSVALAVGLVLCVVPALLLLPIVVGTLEVAYRRMFPAQSAPAVDPAPQEPEAAPGWGAG